MFKINHFYRSVLTLMLVFVFAMSTSAQNLDFPLDLGLFKNSYEESRAQFLKSVADLESINHLTIIKKSYSSPSDASLITDVILIKTKPGNTGLQVYNSGLHGIEGYVGSAVQSWILKNKVSTAGSSDYLFIHALNPYGFKNNRRVNESNIDLNRNFVVDEKTFVSKNQAYAEINSFLNPAEKVRLHLLSRLQFVFSAINLVARYSMDSLRRSILLGQYEFSKGISYGGHEAQYQTNLIRDVYNTIIKPYDKVIFVDLHTGYGEKNKLHLLANSQNLKNAEALQKIFSADRIDLGDKKHFYNVSGDLISYLLKVQKNPNQVLGIAFEFGTANSQTALGSIESLRRMVLENQNFHYNGEDLSSSAEASKLFLELFYPQNDTFKRRALEQVSEEILKIDKALNN